MSESARLSAEQQTLVAESSVVERLARQAARRWPWLGVDDYRSVGHLEIVQAAARYDASRGVPFDAFAFTPVRFAMMKAAMAARSERSPALEAAHAAAGDILGGEVDGGSVWDSADQTNSRVRAMGHALLGSMALGAATLRFAEGSEDAAVDRASQARLVETLRTAMLDLAERERRVLELRYWEGWEFDRIAAALAVSNPTVRRDHRAATERLGQILSGGHKTLIAPAPG